MTRDRGAGARRRGPAARPTYDEAINAQVAQAKAKQGLGDLDELFAQGDSWEVR